MSAEEYSSWSETRRNGPVESFSTSSAGSVISRQDSPVDIDGMSWPSRVCEPYCGSLFRN